MFIYQPSKMILKLPWHQHFLNLLLLLHTIAPAISVKENTCWNAEEECQIYATLNTTMEKAPDLPVLINCQRNDGKENDTNLQQYSIYLSLRNFDGVQNLLLDGCHTAITTTTFGLEYLSNCHHITQITLTRFHMDELHSLRCSHDTHESMQAEVINFERNEITNIAVTSFASEYVRLRKLCFVGNSLRHVERAAFNALNSLEILRMENEPLLALKDAEIVQNTTILTLQLIRLKQITSQLLQHLPRTLQQIHIEHTQIISADVEITLINQQRLQNISIVGCALKAFTLIDSYSTVLDVDLSNNEITEFHAINALVGNATNKKWTCAVERLDLSENKLTNFPVKWLSALPKLRHIVLRRNLLKTISLQHLLIASSVAQLIDLRDNNLTNMQDTDTVISDYENTRIRIDRNPWNCIWLLEFAHTYPEKFRLFQYEKFISKINVNGLECNAANTLDKLMPLKESGQGAKTKIGKVITTPTERSKVNVSTYTLVYSSPYDFKRNQKAEALIIVFMLPLGIAVLFLLLYMWIYCQKVFHLSYYRSFPFMNRRNSLPCNIGRSTEHCVDVIRQLPHATTAITDVSAENEGYELPLNGILSNCNCNNATSGLNTPKMCHRKHHITYEILPSEQPYKLYEEIDDAMINEHGQIYI